ncbi:MAG: hypothetical protein UD936_01395 [Acutalibacteraceae bacterium]|nr:hypothetical protein [Acutalibacteraceae bacterium]
MNDGVFYEKMVINILEIISMNILSLDVHTYLPWSEQMFEYCKSR